MENKFRGPPYPPHHNRSYRQITANFVPSHLTALIQNDEHVSSSIFQGKTNGSIFKSPGSHLHGVGGQADQGHGGAHHLCVEVFQSTCCITFVFLEQILLLNSLCFPIITSATA